MTQGKLSVNAKPPSAEGQGEKKDAAAAPPAPPTYEEATAGEGMKAGAYPPPPSVPLHPSWAYVDPSSSPSYGSGGYPGDTEMLTTFSWDDRNVRRVFIRKVQREGPLSPALQRSREPVKGYIQMNPAWYWTAPLVPCWPVLPLGSALVTRCPLPPQFDFTSYQGVLFVMLMVLFFGGIILAVILPYQYVSNTLHASFLAKLPPLFLQFLAFDTQMLMGNRRYSLSPEEYIFGALNIYLDIIYIFSFFLQFFGSSQE
uniref:Protein lifeguard 2 n=1 Tax=Nothoprocta perdicaria TaxID=30464 RepID=A0A8C6YP94_NOTPE